MYNNVHVFISETVMFPYINESRLRLPGHLRLLHLRQCLSALTALDVSMASIMPNVMINLILFYHI